MADPIVERAGEEPFPFRLGFTFAVRSVVDFRAGVGSSATSPVWGKRLIYFEVKILGSDLRECAICHA
jgi:hypothetical protein